jgi:phosphohistidine phosphatase
VGRALRDAGLVLDQVICSTARRTRETWELVAPEAGGDPAVEWDVRIYAATAGALIEVIREVPEKVGTLLIVGHNPGAHDLTLTLAGPGEPSALQAVQRKFPTAAFAALTVSGSWAHLGPGGAELSSFAVPRG